ncbi:hypothetical protein GCG54_00001407 [Colletotrichum gloeosporioides]|uniref:Heterokaryon incompatibility domain-containing protein n=1 Tax=Colletotrichum gloeosporioides TaxID=474922 RepID=A0A8H4C8E9_COLGL|nr:uncharacterized protein GCG54_00001407 [Colletotrichum gloeosporioides]KAF3799365.1 hypothetical protein GCG54_00001407 [Colletotrichum gloeosporioides]
MISVTENLFHALRRIRAHQMFAEEALWIDAICIDQSFTEERNHQVRIMGKIYTDCTNGLVWLGDLESNLNDSVFVEAHRECWSFAGDFSDYERLWARLVKVLGITRRESASVKRCTSNDAFKSEERILEV